MALRIRELFIYPLKSAAGLRVADATIDALGFAGDRRWMVTDAGGGFVSQRQIPAMARLQATNTGDGLFLSAPHAGSVHVPFPSSHAADRAVTIWDDEVNARDGGDAAAGWLSAVLGIDARLVYCPPDRSRTVDTTYASGDERVGFADGFPLLVLGYTSVQEINARLRRKGVGEIGVERFRPNIVIEGGEPFAEDEWKSVAVTTAEGTVQLDLVKPCARCSIISVDPRTGAQGVEPMRTLAEYRQRCGKVYVAQNALARGEGRLTTGAAVSVL